MTGFTDLLYAGMTSMSIVTVAWVWWMQHPIEEEELSEINWKIGARKPSRKKKAFK